MAANRPTTVVMGHEEIREAIELWVNAHADMEGGEYAVHIETTGNHGVIDSISIRLELQEEGGDDVDP